MPDDGGMAAFKRRQQRMKTEPVEAAQKTMLRGANRVADHMRALAPVLDGDLRDSIVVTPPGQMTPAYASGGRRYAGPGQVLITAGNDQVRYAVPVEHGTSKMEAQPFFFPPVRLLSREVNKQIGNSFKRTVRRVGRGK